MPELFGVLFCLAALPLGIYLLFYKRKFAGVVPEPVWFQKISPAAQNVHRREINKLCAKKFWAEWFSEYFHGQRSAFYAIWTWTIWVPFAAKLMLVLYDLILSRMEILDTSVYVTFSIVFALMRLYFYFASYIVWQCSNNSTKFYKYAIRIALILFIAVHIINDIQILFGQALMPPSLS